MNPSNFICNIEAAVRTTGAKSGESRGTGVAEKRWSTAAFNGHDKATNSFSNRHFNSKTAARTSGAKSEDPAYTGDALAFPAGGA